MSDRIKKGDKVLVPELGKVCEVNHVSDTHARLVGLNRGIRLENVDKVHSGPPLPWASEGDRYVLRFEDGSTTVWDSGSSSCSAKATHHWAYRAPDTSALEPERPS